METREFFFAQSKAKNDYVRHKWHTGYQYTTRHYVCVEGDEKLNDNYTHIYKYHLDLYIIQTQTNIGKRRWGWKRQQISRYTR